VRFELDGCRLGNSHARVAVEMLFSASGAIPFAGVFVALAGEFVAATDAVTVSGFGSGFDRYEGHGESL
jgi:hypothetical protein